MHICGGFAPSFPFPRTKEVDFGRHMPAKDAEAQGNLPRASAQRKLLGEALAKGDPAMVGEAADAYLPLAIGMWHAMEQVDPYTLC
jgi:hypothetical protein